MHCNMHNCSRSRALHRFLIVAFIAVLDVASMNTNIVVHLFFITSELGILLLVTPKIFFKDTVPRTSYGALTSPMKKVAVTIEKS